MRRRCCRTVLAGLLVLWGVPAQGQAPQPEAVGGKIVSARDGRPIAHATVTLTEQVSQKAVATVSSADDGSFGFDAVPAGRYDLSGEAPGYLNGSYLQHGNFECDIVTGAGLGTGALVLQLMPAAAISGRIVDEAGEPVQQARVSLYRERSEAAGERFARVRSAMTDETGEYEFDRLAPGRFFVTVKATPWYAVHPMPEPENSVFGYRSAVDPALDVAYPLVFYPNATSADGASPIELKGGDEFTADMQMTPAQALTITVQRPVGEAPNVSNLGLVSTVFGSEDREPAQSSFMEGTQTLVGIAPGQYGLEKYGSASGLPVRVHTVDLTNSSVSLPPIGSDAGATVKVTLAPAPGAALPAGIQVRLQEARGMATIQASQNTAVEFRELPPGEYRVLAFAENRPLHVAGVAVDGQASADRHLHVSGSGTLSVTITLAGIGTKVQGSALRDGKAAAGSMVVLVQAGADTSEELFRRDETDLDGRFTLNNVPPGKYILVAIDDGWELRWNDPKTLMPYLLHGRPVEMGGNHSAEVHLGEPVITQAR